MLNPLAASILPLIILYINRKSIITLLTPLLISLIPLLINWAVTYYEDKKIYLPFWFTIIFGFGWFLHTVLLINFYDGLLPWDRSYKNYIKELKELNDKKKYDEEIEGQLQLGFGVVVYCIYMFVLSEKYNDYAIPILNFNKKSFKEAPSEQPQSATP